MRPLHEHLKRGLRTAPDTTRTLSFRDGLQFGVGVSYELPE